MIVLSSAFPSRAKFRDEYDGLQLLVNLIDTILLGRGVGQAPGGDTSGGATTPGAEGGRDGASVEAATEEKEEEGEGEGNGRGVKEGERGGQEVEGESKTGGGALDESHPVESDCLVREKRHCVAPSRGRGKYFLPLPPSRDLVNILPAPLGDAQMGWISEALKVVFNQSAHWKQEEDYEDVRL